MKKTLSLVLTMCMVLSLFATFVISASADDVLTWEDGWVNDPADDKPEENGQNILFNNAYGYTFTLDADGKINGEDNIVVTTSEAYLGCNPNWAVSVLLKPAGDLYEVVTIVMNPGDVATNGLPEAINFDNGNIVLVAHSAYSNDLGANYTSKLCALALKVGDKVKVAEDKSSVYVLIPGVDDKEEVPVKNVNVALNKTSYTTSQLFRQNEQWSWGEDSPIAYPDEDGKTLTDGVFALTEAHHLYDAEAGAWMGFHAQCPDYVENGYAWIKLDLGAAYDLTDVVVYAASSAVDNANPTKIDVRVSADGNEWADFASADVVDDASVTTLKTTVSGSANARYVEIRMTTGGGWLAVCEAEVYANVADDSGSEIVKEEITVDGAVTDNGWAADKWTAVSSENGFWQQQYEFETGAKVCPEFGYKYQFRTDDTKLYAAVVIDGDIVDGGNGAGTFVRFWIRDNDEATVYTSFYDFGFAEGEITTAAKYNTSTTTNAGAAIEDTTVVAKASVVDGKTVIEFSIDIAEFCEDGKFDYYICASQKVGEDFGTLYFPAAPIGPTSEEGGDAHQPHANLPWLSWHVATDATVDVADLALGEIVVGGETDDNLGDAGIYAIAALAVVALIGTAIVIKKRA